MAKPSAFVILRGSCSWKNIHGGHGWHRILKYNYALHVQILFILQCLKCISWISQGFSEYPASVRALQWIIFQPTNLMKGGQAQHLAFLPVLVTLDLSKSLQRPGKLYYVTVYCAVIWVFNIPLSCRCSFAEPMLWLPASHNLRLLGSYP